MSIVPSFPLYSLLFNRVIYKPRIVSFLKRQRMPLNKILQRLFILPYMLKVLITQLMSIKQFRRYFQFYLNSESICSFIILWI